jgi:histidinol-phosphatase (PHP family)
MNPSAGQLALMCERGIPAVLGADAHTPFRVAAGYEAALDMLAAAGYREVSFFLERKRQTVPIAAARASLR